MKRAFVPDAGDIVWLNFSPQAGREQAGHRPALILSPSAYNLKSGLAIACPITSHTKGYPFEVPIVSSQISGAALTDHLRSIDWGARGVTKAGKVKDAVMLEVRDRLAVLLGFK